MPTDGIRVPCISFDYLDCRTSPEKKLLLGVLERACADYLGADPKFVKWEEAFFWITSDSLSLFSYRWVLTELDLDHLHGEIRQALKDMRRSNQRLPEVRIVHK